MRSVRRTRLEGREMPLDPYVRLWSILSQPLRGPRSVRLSLSRDVAERHRSTMGLDPEKGEGQRHHQHRNAWPKSVWEICTPIDSPIVAPRAGYPFWGSSGHALLPGVSSENR